VSKMLGMLWDIDSKLDIVHDDIIIHYLVVVQTS